MKPYYQDKSCTIYLGDCREILPTLDKVDLVLTDPPYGIGESNKKNLSREKLSLPKNYGEYNWDNQKIPQELFDYIQSFAKHCIIFGGNYYQVHPSSCWLVWDKQNGKSDFADCELAWTNLNKAVRKFTWKWQGMLQQNMGQHKEYRFYPTQKPLALMKWCIDIADEIQTILDPFMGSGTTLRAAKDLGRKAIGIEIEEKCCEIAAKRLEQESLFNV